MFFNITRSAALVGPEPENMNTFFCVFAFIFASLLVAVLSGIAIIII
jgi:hypothetical protein